MMSSQLTAAKVDSWNLCSSLKGFWGSSVRVKSVECLSLSIGLMCSDLGNALLSLIGLQVHINAVFWSDLFASGKKLKQNSTANNQSMMLLLEPKKEVTSITKYSVSQIEDLTGKYMLTTLQMS